MPNRHRPLSGQTNDIWRQYEPVIRQLYLKERKTLNEVKGIMERGYHFPMIALSTYITKLGDLGLHKELRHLKSHMGTSSLTTTSPTVVSPSGNLSEAQHSPEYLWQCPQCDQKFTCKFSRENHIRGVHTHERPFLCTQCTKAFSQKHDLKIHQADVHRRERKFVCKRQRADGFDLDCGMRFARQSNLNRHILSCRHQVSISHMDTRHRATQELRRVTLSNEQHGDLKDSSLDTVVGIAALNARTSPIEMSFSHEETTPAQQASEPFSITAETTKPTTNGPVYPDYVWKASIEDPFFLQDPIAIGENFLDTAVSPRVCNAPQQQEVSCLSELDQVDDNSSLPDSPPRQSLTSPAQDVSCEMSLLSDEQVPSDIREAAFMTLRNQDLPTLKNIFARSNITPNLTSHHGNTLLGEACSFGCVDAIQWLLGHDGIEANLQDRCGEAPLHLAIHRCSAELIEILLRHPSLNVNLRNEQGFTALMLGIWSGELDIIVKLLTSSSIDVNAALRGSGGTAPNGSTAVSMAVRQQNVEMVQALISHPELDLRTTDSEGNTLLHVAAHHGSNPIVEMLLATGKVDVNLHNMDGDTPLTLALVHGDDNITTTLLEAKSIDLGGDQHGVTPLHLAAWFGRKTIVQRLLKAKQVEINARTDSGRTPLASAYARGDTEIITSLLNADDIDLRAFSATNQESGQLEPICLLTHTARSHSPSLNFKTEALRCLLEYPKCCLGCQDEDGRTPLIWAAITNNQRLVKCIMEFSLFNPVPWHRDSNAQMAFDYAYENIERAKNKKMMDMLNELMRKYLPNIPAPSKTTGIRPGQVASERPEVGESSLASFRTSATTQCPSDLKKYIQRSIEAGHDPRVWYRDRELKPRRRRAGEWRLGRR